MAPAKVESFDRNLNSWLFLLFILKGVKIMQKVAIITGASRGIGRACAMKLAKEGIKVIANYNRSEEKAKSLKKELENQGIEIDIFKADVTKKDDVMSMIEYALNKYGKIDILVNNARHISSKVIY